MPFAIENYKDEILCDVVLMEAGHILLDHLWQLDRKVTNNWYTNCLSFIYNELKITLTPLSPKQVCEDQIKMGKIKECEKLEEKKNERMKEKKTKHHINLIPGAALVNKPTYKNILASWEECLPHLEFSYNRTIQSTYYSSFEVVYGFNPLIPFDILTLPTNKHANLDGMQKEKFVRELHVKRNEQYARQANKGCVMTFEPGDCIWVHRKKERFPTQRKYKLQPRGDGTFQVLKKINDNAYKLDLPTTYDNISPTFNVAYLSLFVVGEESDSRMNPFEEGGNDKD
ncbi:Tf2-9, partial [Mucuna pruriens]